LAPDVKQLPSVETSRLVHLNEAPISNSARRRLNYSTFSPELGCWNTV